MKKYLQQMSEETRNFVLVGVGVFLVLGLFFLITFIRINQPYYVTVPPLSGDNRVQYEEILIGSLTNMPEERYFVFVYKDKGPIFDMYRNLLEQNEMEYRYYRANLNSFFNETYRGDTANDDKENLQFTGNTVVLVENGEIKEFLTTPTEIFSYFES